MTDQEANDGMNGAGKADGLDCNRKALRPGHGANEPLLADVAAEGWHGPRETAAKGVDGEPCSAWREDNRERGIG